MIDGERLRLLFGPYQAPSLRRDDRTSCLFRDCGVVITGWTEGPIPWPRCRALDSPSGGSGLLVDEELARAVRHESAAAVRHWWGASAGAVGRWRQALGVTRAGNEGSRRLIRASSQKGAEAMQAREWAEEERDRLRRLNAGRGLAASLVLGCHGPLWTAGDMALLGQVADEEVARRTGRTAGAVRQKREELGLPNPGATRWRHEETALLGTLPDRELARRLARSLQSVTQKRIKLGIANAFDGRTRNRS